MHSVLNQITSLIEMDVGDPYRLEHIKFRLEQNKDLTISDTKYLNGLLTLSDLRDVEDNENQIITTRPTKSAEENSEFNYCWKCATKNPMANAFCTNCESSIGTVKSTIEINLPKTIPLTKKIRKELVILGLVIMIFGSGAFIVPFGDTDLIINDMNAFCESALGLTIQVFAGEQGSGECNMAFQILLFADFLEILGVIFIILGVTVKKTIFKSKSQSELKL